MTKGLQAAEAGRPVELVREKRRGHRRPAAGLGKGVDAAPQADNLALRHSTRQLPPNHTPPLGEPLHQQGQIEAGLTAHQTMSAL